MNDCTDPLIPCAESRLAASAKYYDRDLPFGRPVARRKIFLNHGGGSHIADVSSKRPFRQTVARIAITARKRKTPIMSGVERPIRGAAVSIPGTDKWRTLHSHF